MSFCRNCGREVQEGAAFCAGCGVSVDGTRNVVYTASPVHERGTNGMAIAGFIAAFLFPLAGIILSAIGLSYAKKYDYTDPLRELAGWGLALSIVFTVLGIVAAVVSTIIGFALLRQFYDIVIEYPPFSF